MKKIFLLLSMTIIMVSLKAQTMVVPVKYIKVDYITLNGGTCLTFNTPAFKLNKQIEPTEPTSSEKTPGMFFQLNIYSSHSDINDFISSGIEMNFYYLKNQWDVTFSNDAVFDPNYNRHFMGKFNEFGYSAGELFTFRFSDNFEMTASAGFFAGFLFCGEVRSEAVHVRNGQVYPDPELNEWHTAKAKTNFSIEVGLYGKLGGYYRLSDGFSVGLIGMYSLPLFGSAVLDMDKSAPNTDAHDLGYGMKVNVGKLQFGSLMLSLRFDID